MPKFEQENKKEGKIESLKENLYSRQDVIRKGHVHQGRFHEHSNRVKKSWEHEDDGEEKPIFMTRKKEGMSFAGKLFLVALGFFVISLGVATFMFLGGSNTISSENVAINVVGPVSVNGGEEISFEVEIDNQNNAALESTYLIVEFPEGARDAKDVKNEMKRYREKIGDIIPGQSAKRKISSVLFGEEGQIKEINIITEYRVRGSNGVFEKRKPYEVIISSSPVSIDIDTLNEISSGQDFETKITITSNSSTVIKDLTLNAEYPFGFSYVSSSPNPTYKQESWNLGELKPNSKKAVILRGRMDGQDGEKRIFKFTVGTADPKDNRIIGVPFFTTSQDVAIEKPFLGLELALNGDTSKTYLADSGGDIRADLLWTNNSATKITGAKIIAKIEGQAVKKTSISTEGGFYRSSDNSIIWDQTNTRGFDVLNPGESGRVSFSFRVLGLADGIASLKNPEFKISISASGDRVEENQTPESIRTAVEKEVKVSSVLGLSARSLYRSGPILNTGPIPPRVDQETTYTVTWTLTSASNDVKNVAVEAILPSYVRWVDVIKPTDADVKYNPVSGKIVWNAGTVEAGSGYGRPVREVSFQIGLTPSLSQVGNSPVLVNTSSASGEDIFTGKRVSAETRVNLTTELITEPSFSFLEAKVTQ